MAKRRIVVEVPERYAKTDEEARLLVMGALQRVGPTQRNYWRGRVRSIAEPPQPEEDISLLLAEAIVASARGNEEIVKDKINKVVDRLGSTYVSGRRST